MGEVLRGHGKLSPSFCPHCGIRIWSDSVSFRRYKCFCRRLCSVRSWISIDDSVVLYWIVSACGFEGEHRPGFLWILQPPGLFSKNLPLEPLPSFSYLKYRITLNPFQLFKFQSSKKRSFFDLVRCTQMKIKKKALVKATHQKWYFFLSHAWFDIAKNPFHPPPSTLDSQDNLMMLEITNLEYLLKCIPLFLLFLKGCGVGDSLDKIRN